MKVPGPDHPISIAPANRRVRVSFAGKVVADTTRALILKEANYEAVFYIPREDAYMGAFSISGHTTHCPYKGDASHYALDGLGKRSENAAWSYERPFPAVREIAGHLAFYPKRVDRIEVLDA